jgi:hypothetical protein
MSRITSKVTPQTENKTNNVVQTPMTTVPEIKEEVFINWLTQLYNTDDINDNMIKSFHDAFSYQGFNRNEVLKQLSIKVNDKNLVLQLIVAGALRGPQQGSRLKLTNGKSALEMGIPASGQKGTKTLTMNKIISATSDLAAWILKKMKVPQRLVSDLPGWLQFPSAGSIKLPDKYRTQHIEFSKTFSKLIGGEFNEQIYNTMQLNSYLDDNLHLFDN